MAKKVGDDAPKTGAKTPSAPAPPDDNMTASKYLTAVKEITAAREVVAVANEAMKKTRKKWKANGIELGVLDSMVKMTLWGRGEIRDFFEVQAQYATWLGLPIERPRDMYKGMSDDQIQRAEFRAAGKTAALAGLPAKPPEEVPEEFHQEWLGGFHEADDAAWDESDAGDAPTNAPAVH